jgi:hypothetical protein
LDGAVLHLGPLDLTDPVVAPAHGGGPISRWIQRHLHDPRDEVFVWLTLATTLRMAVLMGALAVALYVADLPPLWVAAAYLVAWGWTVPPVVLMLHNTMHRPFVRRPRWGSRAQLYGMSFFLGIPPAYPEHHLGMHHAEDNMWEDLSSTLRYRRDSFVHFLVYFLRFLLLGHAEVSAYLYRHGRRKMARRLLAGEAAQIVLVTTACWIAPAFGLIAFALPAVVIRFMMMMGNWGQHAFINTSRPNDGLSNSVTCINSAYNRRCFNDGYHIGHHLKASRHYTELPGDFAENRARYAAAGAVVFSGLDFFMISLLLWTGRWRVLARHYVRLDGKPHTDDEVIAMLKARVEPVREWSVELRPRPSG